MGLAGLSDIMRARSWVPEYGLPLAPLTFHRRGGRPLPYCDRCGEIVCDDTHDCRPKLTARTIKLPCPENMVTR